MTTISEYLHMEEPDPTEPDEFYYHSWNDPRFNRLRGRFIDLAEEADDQYEGDER